MYPSTFENLQNHIMYEVEYKVEITKDEQDMLFALFNTQNFERKDTVTQNDYYVEAVPSEHGGFNLKRYRDEGTKVIYAEKVWEVIDEQKVRKEVEHEVSREEFDTELAKYPDALKIIKDRNSFTGKLADKVMHIDMDDVKFDHSPQMRYFIEAEVLVGDKGEVNSTRDTLVAFLKESLSREIVESPGMFSMAFKKL